MIFDIPEEIRSGHISACQELILHGRADKHLMLASLLRIIQEGDPNLECTPEAILHLGINMDDPLPVPTLDLRAPKQTGWSGLHALFAVGPPSDRKCGHFIVRNFSSSIDDHFEHNEYFELVRQHEIHHILQTMSGSACSMLTPDDMKFCANNHRMLPVLAAQKDLSQKCAFALAGRFLLQQFRNELDAYNSVDFPIALDKFGNNMLYLQRWRANVLCTVLRDLITPICCAFVDTYDLDWHELVASIRTTLNEMLKGTFLENPVVLNSVKMTPLSFLESISAKNGLLRNLNLDLGAFSRITELIPLVGQVAVYNPLHGHASEFLAAHPLPVPTLIHLAIKGLHEGCIATTNLPCNLKYDIVTHWSCNAPGTWDVDIVETAPNGEQLKHTYPLVTESKGAVNRLLIAKTMLFRQPGRYEIEVRIGRDTIAKTSFRVILR